MALVLPDGVSERVFVAIDRNNHVVYLGGIAVVFQQDAVYDLISVRRKPLQYRSNSALASLSFGGNQSDKQDDYRYKGDEGEYGEDIYYYCHSGSVSQAAEKPIAARSTLG